jgi:hypothetical protein
MINKFQPAVMIPANVWLVFKAKFIESAGIFFRPDMNGDEIFTALLICVHDRCEDWCHLGRVPEHQSYLL